MQEFPLNTTLYFFKYELNVIYDLSEMLISAKQVKKIGWTDITNFD